MWLEQAIIDHEILTAGRVNALPELDMRMEKTGQDWLGRGVGRRRFRRQTGIILSWDNSLRPSGRVQGPDDPRLHE